MRPGWRDDILAVLAPVSFAAANPFERVAHGHERRAPVPVPGLRRGHDLPCIGDIVGVRLGQVLDRALLRRVASDHRLKRADGTVGDEDRHRRAATLSLAPPPSV